MRIQSRTGVEHSNDISLNDFGLLRNYPNPFNNATRISYQIRTAGPVRIDVTDVSGRIVRHLLQESVLPGRYEIIWDGRNDGGRSVPTGIYFCRLHSADAEHVQKMLLVR